MRLRWIIVLRAAAAYAPACDVESRWGTDLAKLNRIVPGAVNLAARVSPMRHVDDMACPIFLFHADDDTNVRTSDNDAYAAALQSAGKTVQVSHVPTGGHYQSMIDKGIPGGIAFFKAQGRATHSARGSAAHVTKHAAQDYSSTRPQRIERYCDSAAVKRQVPARKAFLRNRPKSRLQLSLMRLPIVETLATAPAPAAGNFDSGPRSIEAVRVLRLSITDRCNFRCVYCMPAEGMPWLRREDILSFEEIRDVVRAAIEVHGIRRFKLTGGEPTVRDGLVELVGILCRIPGVEDLSLTTNGQRLSELAYPLRRRVGSGYGEH